MSEITDTAKLLGQKIRQLPLYQEYREASKEINSDEEKKALLDSYYEIIGKINQQIDGNGDVAKLKEEYEALAAKINSDPDLVKFMKAQGHFMALMDDVTAILTKNLPKEDILS